MPYLVIGSALVLVATFALSAAGKLRGRAEYAGFVAATGRLLPAGPRVVALAAGAVLTAELGLPLLLLLRPAIGFGLAALLLSGFAVALAAAVRRGVRQPCRCFGAGSGRLGYRHAVRAGALAVLAGAAAVAAGWSDVPALLTAVHPGGVLVALAAAGLITVLTVSVDELAELFAPAR